QQVVVSLGPEAIRSLAGSDDLEAVLAFSPDRVLEAVQAGQVKAQSIERSTIEIKGSKARLQAEGKPSYTILDAGRRVTNTVMPDNPMIIVMDAAEREKAANSESERQQPERVGEQPIRGLATTGYRFDFFGDNVATVWLSEELTASIGPVLDVWLDA